MSLPKSVVYDLPAIECADTVDWTVEPGRTVLLIHDMQEHFVGPFQRDAEPLRTAAAEHPAATSTSAAVCAASCVWVKTMVPADPRTAGERPANASVFIRVSASNALRLANRAR